MTLAQDTLARFRDVVVHNNDRIALELSLALAKRPEAEQRAALGGDMQVGFAYLYRNEQLHPDKVLETIVSPAGDAITSLYLIHPIFGSHGALMAARRSLMEALSEQLGLSITSIGIDDSARGRALGLSELSTGQLIDLLAERLGSTVLVTNSHGGSVDLAKQVMPS